MLWYFQAYSKVKQLLIYIYPLFLEGTTQYLAEFSVLYNCCCSSAAKSCLILVTSCTVAHQASLSSTISQSLGKFISIESVMLSNHFILCHPLLLLPPIFPSNRVCSNESAILSNHFILCHPLLCLQSFPASGSFPVSQLITSGGQSVGALASASVLPMTIQG